MLFRPSKENYEAVRSDPRAKATRAIAWLLIASTIFQIAQAVVITRIINEVPAYRLPEQLRNWNSSFVVCNVFINWALLVVLLGVVTFIYHLLARVLGGRGEYTSFFYIIGMVFIPLYLLQAMFLLATFSPSVALIIGILNFILSIYSSVLLGYALYAVYQLSLVKIFLLVVVLPLLIIFFIAQSDVTVIRQLVPL